MNNLVIFLALVGFGLWVIWMTRQPRDNAGTPVKQGRSGGDLSGNAYGDDYRDGSAQPAPVAAQAHREYWERRDREQPAEQPVETHSHTVSGKATAGWLNNALSRSEGEKVRK